MYVIFPADEVVYLSYGRLIYVPSSPPLDNQPVTPIRTTSPPNEYHLPQPSIPSTTSSSTKSRKSTASEPIFTSTPTEVQTSSSRSLSQPCTSREDVEPPVKPIRKKKSFKLPSLPKPKTPLLERKLSFSDFLSKKTSKQTNSVNFEEQTNSENSLKQKSVAKTTKSETPKSTLTRQASVKKDSLKKENSPGGKVEKLPLKRENSFKLQKPPVRKEKSPIKIENPVAVRNPVTINGERCLKKEKPSSSKREKSPAIRIFRAKSSSPSKEHLNFDSLFNRETSPGKLSVQSYHSVMLSEDSSRTKQTPTEKSSPTKKKAFFGNVGVKRAPSDPSPVKMAASTKTTNDSPLRDLTHQGYNEHLKAHNSVSFKLVKTVSDFTQQLGQMYEQHAEELQMLVANFRKRNGELRKERPACPSSLFHTWETLLQEVEIDSQALSDIASILGRQVSRPLLERSFHRKIQSRKVFTHRESYETIITKTEEKLAKCRQEYKNAYLSYLANPTQESLSSYFNAHNAYVQQLHATNGMMEEYGKETLPSLLQELEEIYTDLCSTVSDAVLQGAEVVSGRAMEQCRRYEGLVSQCKSVSGAADLTHLSRSLPQPQGRGPVTKRIFVPPQPPPPPDPIDGEPQEVQNENIPPPLKDELIIDRLSAVQVRPSHEALKKEALDLETQIRQIQDALDTLLRIQQRSVEANLYNKANELQEDISMKRFDLRVAQMHLSAINSQKELFTSKLEGETGRERKMSGASTASMKNKWLKAFKSLKTPPPETEKKNGSAATKELLKGDPDAHNFQENTYKKITPCDVCSQVLRGHTRQGLKCRICKMNVHLDCQDKASKCQTKARLLRRQKSTSEIETRVPETTVEEERISEVYTMPTINRRLSMRDANRLYPPQMTNSVIESPEIDQIYQVLKQATEISNSKPRVNVEPAPPVAGAGSNPGSSGSSGQSLNRRTPAPQPSRAAGSTLAVVNPAPCSTSSDRRQQQLQQQQGTPIVAESSSMRRRIFAGMKSLTGFGSRSRHGSPGHRSISLPEKRKSTDASGTRPFGQPLCIGPQIKNGNGLDSLPPTPPCPSPTPSKGKVSPTGKKPAKPKK